MASSHFSVGLFWILPGSPSCNEAGNRSALPSDCPARAPGKGPFSPLGQDGPVNDNTIPECQQCVSKALF